MKFNQYTKFKPEKWSKIYGIHILDPDGWDRRAANFQQDWETPITRSEFKSKAVISTAYPTDIKRFKKLFPF